MTDNSRPITTSDPKIAVREWFAQLSRNCAAVDYESTRAIFAEDVVMSAMRRSIRILTVS